jgi:hypothetical protein
LFSERRSKPERRKRHPYPPPVAQSKEPGQSAPALF